MAAPPAKHFPPTYHIWYHQHTELSRYSCCTFAISVTSLADDICDREGGGTRGRTLVPSGEARSIGGKSPSAATALRAMSPTYGVHASDRRDFLGSFTRSHDGRYAGKMISVRVGRPAPAFCSQSCTQQQVDCMRRRVALIRKLQWV